MCSFRQMMHEASLKFPSITGEQVIGFSRSRRWRLEELRIFSPLLHFITESNQTLERRRCRTKKPKQSRFSLFPASGENSGQIPAQSPGRPDPAGWPGKPGKSSWLPLHKRGSSGRALVSRRSRTWQAWRENFSRSRLSSTRI